MLGDRIVALGGTPIVLDAGSLDNSVSFRFPQSYRGGVHLRLPSGDEVDCTKFDAVWFRLKPVIPLPSWGPLEASAAVFSQGEWRTVIRSFSLFLSSARWMNAVEPQTAISSKLRQLDLATRLGFRVPDTVVTNSPDVVLQMLLFIKE